MAWVWSPARDRVTPPDGERPQRHQRLQPWREVSPDEPAETCTVMFERAVDLAELAYVLPDRSNGQHLTVLAGWLHTYNHHHCHAALGAQPPMSRVNNVSGHNIELWSERCP
jgi:transposase InsO family protein